MNPRTTTVCISSIGPVCGSCVLLVVAEEFEVDCEDGEEDTTEGDVWRDCGTGDEGWGWLLLPDVDADIWLWKKATPPTKSAANTIAITTKLSTEPP